MAFIFSAGDTKGASLPFLVHYPYFYIFGSCRDFSMWQSNDLRTQNDNIVQSPEEVGGGGVPKGTRFLGTKSCDRIRPVWTILKGKPKAFGSAVCHLNNLNA